MIHPPHIYVRNRLLARYVLCLSILAVLQLARIAVQGGERRAEQERERPQARIEQREDYAVGYFRPVEEP